MLLIEYGKWNDYLSVMLIVRNNNLPLFRIIMADMKQYLIDELPCAVISVIQRIKLISDIIGDTALLGRQMKIEAWH